MAEKPTRSKVQGGWTRSGPSHARGSKNASVKSRQSEIGNPVEPSGRFTFENAAVPKEPSHRTINSSGEYIISNEPNGESKLTLRENFIGQSDCEWMFQQIHDELQWHQHKVRRNGTSYLQPRMTAWVGDVPYSYSGITHERSTQWTPMLTMLRDTVESQTGRPYNSVLANLYRDGHDHLPWHSDDEPEFGSHPSIASLSFGETRTFELRRKPFDASSQENPGRFAGELKDSDYLEYIRVPLEAGTLMLMEGAVQLDWQHRVQREYHDKKPRINLTFRFVTVEERR